MFGAIILTAAVLGRTGATDPLAMFVFYARVGQSVTHMISASALAVWIRATFFLAQVGMMFWMLFQLASG